MTEEEKQKKIDDDYNEMMRNVAINAMAITNKTP